MRKFGLVFQVAATYIGTIVGAGFASGKEVIQFFTQFGEFGTLGVAASGALFTWIGTKMLIFSSRIKAYSFNELMAYIFGERLGTVIQSLIFFIIFGVTGVMLAGAGATFEEQLGLPKQLGIILSVIACLMLLYKGFRGVLWVNSLIVPLMFSLTLSLYFRHGADAGYNWLPDGLPDNYHWLIRALSYAAFNMMTALAVLVPLGKEIKDEKVLGLGGLVGGLGFTVLLCLTHFILLGHHIASGFDIPMAEIVKNFGPAIHLLFVCVIYGEIFTTFIGNIFGMTRQLQSLLPIGHFPSVLLLLLCTFLISQAGYGSLIKMLYPLYGYLCAACFIYLMWVKLPPKN